MFIQKAKARSSLLWRRSPLRSQLMSLIEIKVVASNEHFVQTKSVRNAQIKDNLNGTFWRVTGLHLSGLNEAKEVSLFVRHGT